MFEPEPQRTWPKSGPKFGLDAGLDAKFSLRFTNAAQFRNPFKPIWTFPNWKRFCSNQRPILGSILPEMVPRGSDLPNLNLPSGCGKPSAQLRSSSVNNLRLAIAITNAHQLAHISHKPRFLVPSFHSAALTTLRHNLRSRVLLPLRAANVKHNSSMCFSWDKQCLNHNLNAIGFLGYSLPRLVLSHRPAIGKTFRIQL
jgi:hypothetical protein